MNDNKTTTSDNQPAPPPPATATENKKPKTENPAAAPAAPVAPVAREPRLRLRTSLIIIAALALAAWGLHYGLRLWRYETTDDAYIVGHVHQISAQVGGQVKTLHVEDNQLVKAGDTIVEIDPLQYEIAAQKAAATLAQTRAEESKAAAALAQTKAADAEAQARVAQAQAQVAQTRAQIGQIAAQLNLDRINLDRAQRLYAGGNGAATQADVDNARAAVETAEAAQTAAEATQAAAQANHAAAQSATASTAAARDAAAAQADAARAAAAAAEAAQRDAQRLLSYTRVTAPADGRIGARTVEAGNLIQAGQLLCALTSPDMWIVANFKETQLTHMQAGQEVEIRIDALPDEKLIGRIDSFSPASGAQFALLPPDNATGNFNKVVQRVPVKITFDPKDIARLGPRLHLGYSVVVDVRVR